MNRYILYARKSQEDEGRQQQSIDDQIRIMTEIAGRNGLNVVVNLTEERSAKEPYQRPVFDRLIKMIKSGEADSILCYHVNRLARNMVEGGLLQHMLTKCQIKEIRTYNEVFTSRDNILPFILQTAMSTQFSLDLSQHVKRGLDSKVRKGDYPTRAPEGYRNNVYNRMIEKDPERFLLVRQAWDLMLSDTYSVERLLSVMTNQWSYRTRKTRKAGGRPLSRSGLHFLFHNVFYTGYFSYNGELHKGNHEPMITFEEFETVQRILGQRTRARAQKHEFAYTGMISCSACGRMVTAEFQRGQLKRGRYIYYHCTNHRVCRSPFVREERIEADIRNHLRSIGIRPDYQVAAKKAVQKMYARDGEKAVTEAESCHRQVIEAEERRSKLVRLVVDGLISDEEFGQEKARFEVQLNELRRAAIAADSNVKRAQEGTLEVARFAAAAPLEFEHCRTHRRREIARTLAQSYRLLPTGQLEIELHPLLAPLCQGLIEPQKSSRSTCTPAGTANSVQRGRTEQTLLEPLSQIWKLLFDGAPRLNKISQDEGSANEELLAV